MSRSTFHPLRLAVVVASIMMLGLAAYASVRRYRVELLVGTATEENLRQALTLAPANAEAWARLGKVLEKRGDGPGAARALAQSVELNRYDAGAWVDLGLRWEMDGDVQRAEQCLRAGVGVDSTFYPRWALANFYLRQGAQEQFWPAMRNAISCGRADLTSAFALCWRAFQDADGILEKGIPDVPEINRRYWAFLMQEGRTAAAAGLWKRIGARLQPADRELALRYADALLADRQVDGAVRVWNQLCAAGLMPHQPLDPARGRMLTNGRFLLPPSARAFDWRLTEPDGISSDVENSGAQSRLSIHFSGAHPEATELLSQFLPALQRQAYRLRYRYSTFGLPVDTGLYWTVEDAAGGAQLMTTDRLSATQEDWKDKQATFQTGPGTRLIRVVFAYRRSPGTTRAQGSVALSDVDLSPAERKLDAGRQGHEVQP